MEKQNTNPDFIILAEKIESLSPLILSEWQKNVLTNLEKRKKETFIILLDHMPEILNSLVDSLKQGSRDDIELAKAHGFQRAVLTQFDITDILNEFSLLRETLISYLYPIGSLEGACYLHWYIDSLSKNSVLEFINTLSANSNRVNTPTEKAEPLSQSFS